MLVIFYSTKWWPLKPKLFGQQITTVHREVIPLWPLVDLHYACVVKFHTLRHPSKTASETDY